ncbi:MAG UNVERIFIED_CONTAM: hypothetical protein LVR18_49720 [Planctomycetaceae bacterium]
MAVRSGSTTNAHRPVSQEPFRLERIQRLADAASAHHTCGSPPSISPGTKGKGSTAAMIESIARHAGIRTGLFTSPHIEQFEERMRVNSHMPSPKHSPDWYSSCGQPAGIATGRRR